MKFRNFVQIFCVLSCLTYLAGCEDDSPTNTSPAPTTSGAPNESITSSQPESSQADRQVTESNETSTQPLSSDVTENNKIQSQPSPLITSTFSTSALIQMSLEDLNRLLINSSISGDAETVRTVLDAGADVNTSHNHCTPIFYAARAFDCWAAGEESDDPVIMRHPREAPYHHSVIELLLDRGANLNQSNILNLSYFLVRATQFEDELAVTKALEAGAEPDRFLAKPLFIASTKGNVNIVRALILAGVEIDSKTCRWEGNSQPQQMTSLDIARERGHEDVERILLDAGARTARDAGNIPPAICHHLNM